MTRSPGGRAAPRLAALLAALSALALCAAGPVGPLPNVTSSDLGLKEGGCALGDVVYLPGDELPGAGPCERCTCARGGVQCARTRCEPRAGCKALHRPDHCCPTYQCECEQEGRVYGNGEKLVDPQDPCRVCYCQGGEVVCRRIACFVRDDCRPRRVPGRCCPEYDDCPLRGVTTIPGVAPPALETAPAASSPPGASGKQEITIKEITPVSEIPVITEVKIKEIPSSLSMEGAEYASSKSPLIVREATSESSATSDDYSSSSSGAPVRPQPARAGDAEPADDAPPSKISLSTQDSINSEIYPAAVAEGAGTAGPAPPASSARAPALEEDDTSLFEHNPAFPPIPDDLSVLSSHDEENVPEQSADAESGAPTASVALLPVATAAPAATDSVATTSWASAGTTPDTTVKIAQTDTAIDGPRAAHGAPDEAAAPGGPRAVHGAQDEAATPSGPRAAHGAPDEAAAPGGPRAAHGAPDEAAAPGGRRSPMLNLRSVIPTEILNVPSFVPEDTTGDLDNVGDVATDVTLVFTSTTENVVKLEEKLTEEPKIELKTDSSSTTAALATSQRVATVTQGDATTTERIAITTQRVATTTQEVDIATESAAATSERVATTTERTVATTTERTVASTTERTVATTTERTVATSEPAAIIMQRGAIITQHAVDTTQRTGIDTERTAGITQRTDATTEWASATTRLTDATTERVAATTRRVPAPLQTASSTDESNIAAETTAKTELSSVPIDQTVHELPENISDGKIISSTEEPRVDTTLLTAPTDTQALPVPEAAPAGEELESGETTEFVVTARGASESAPGAVELIRVSAAPARRDGNVLADLIDLVGDMGSIGAHTAGGVANPEEPVPVNAGYKSKNSNWNLNSITETPAKSRSQGPGSKQRVEIEDEEADELADASPPREHAEPTTRRALIDSVADDVGGAPAPARPDVEIITKSYVPTLSRRPTKVLLASGESLASEEPETGAPAAPAAGGITEQPAPAAPAAR